MTDAPVVLRVGGVAEPFNLPWIRTFERDAFAHLGIEVTFTEFAGGTGALVKALERGEIDVATLLTEGAVTAIARGAPLRLHSAFTASPLTWGIHTAHTAQADSAGDAATVSDLEGQRFAISRYGSGSELMAYVLAEEQGWTLAEDQFVVVGGVDGATEALPNGTAEIFLWERFVTAPLVRAQVFSRVGDLNTPWPAFYTATRTGFLKDHGDLLDRVVQIVLDQAQSIAHNAPIEEIVDRYGMSPDDVRSWLARTEWPSSMGCDDEVLEQVMATMAELGRIEAPVALSELR